MGLLERWKAPTPLFFKRVIKVSIGASVGAIALLNADTLGNAVVPGFHYTLMPVVATIAKNIMVSGFVAAAIAKFTKQDTDENKPQP